MKALNLAGQIAITIENQDQFLHLLKTGNTRYADAHLIVLTHNGLVHLFSSPKLTLAEQMVEHVNYPGQATTLLGLATYSPDYSKGCGLIHGWICNTSTLPDTDPRPKG